MAREVVVEKKRESLLTGRYSLLTALAIGALVGVFGWLFTLGINSWVLHPVLCRSADTASACASSDITAWVIAHVVVSIIGLFLLIRVGVFRPLLVVLAALITLWAVGLWFVSSPWWVGLLWEAGLFAAAYMLYKWVAAVDRFVIAAILTVVLVVVMRLIIAA